MNLHATTAFPDEEHTYLPWLRDLAARDRIGKHRLVEDARKADFILFLDAHQHPEDLSLSAIRKHPLVRKNRGRVFIYNELDQPWCALPGLYVSMPRRSFDARRQRAFPYLKLPNPYVLAPGNHAQEPRWLYSFLGRRCHPVRDRVLALKDPRGMVEDTSAVFDALHLPSDHVERCKRRYAEVTADSKFVLCPRGAGPSSFRLYEAMAAGRAPVILSDEWVPPGGPAWQDCSLRVPEAKAAELPAMLVREEHRAARMGAEARRAWEQWFAPEVLFHQIVENCRELSQANSRKIVDHLRLTDRRYLYLWARAMKWKIRSRHAALASLIPELIARKS